MIKSKTGEGITSIYTSDEKEIIEVRDNQNNIVYSAIDEISGVTPLRFKSRGGYLQDYRIYGNTVQNGTPTPENPVEVQGCGEYDAELNGYKIPVTVSNGTNSITTPVYIGSEPLHKIGDYADYVDFKRGVVVRRIKKLVLTGNENWVKETGNTYAIEGIPLMRLGYCDTLCTHYVIATSYKALTSTDCTFSLSRRPALFIHDNRCTTASALKSYLATQYAAGTPVTVWYVLDEPEEEPLENLLPIQTIKGTNILTADTTVQPSNIWIKGKIKSID